MTPEHPSARWLKRLERAGRPLYLALVEALEGAIRDGELQAGDQLPPQRTVATLIGVDFTTVTRAYGLARDRGLVEGEMGRGTFVRARAAEDDAGLVDLRMNLPPPPEGVSLAAMLKETTAAILARTDAQALMAYHPGAGTLGQKTAAAWLAPVLGEVKPERILVCAGAQTGLAASLHAVTRPGDVLIVEPLTYPGLMAAARQTGVRLAACPVDEEGVDPGAFDRLCAETGARAAYLVPATQNPVATTMGIERRRAVAAIVRARGLWLIEDDPYSRLFDAPVAGLASFAAERTFHIATLSKALTPGLRVAFLIAPDAALAERAGESLRALSLMAAPLMAVIAATWIRDGSADALLAGVRAEARARRRIAARLLPAAVGAPESLHVWIDLPASWSPERLRRTAAERGLSLVTADVFAASDDHANGLRISLGGPARRAVLEPALESIGLMLKAPAPGGRVVV